MKTLYILRHAKSSWDGFQGSDHDRPLNSRGLKAAPLMGKILSSFTPPPELILTSTAQRAQQTANLVQEVLNQHHEHTIKIIADAEIYVAPAMSLFYKILELPSEIDTVLLIGHNPILEELVSILSYGNSDGNIRMPTAALAGITFRAESWENIKIGEGLLNMLIFPKLMENLIK